LIHDDKGSKLETEDVKRRLEGMTPEEKVKWVFEESERSDWDDISVGLFCTEVIN
jgi:hypothetical protein